MRAISASSSRGIGDPRNDLRHVFHEPLDFIPPKPNRTVGESVVWQRSLARQSRSRADGPTQASVNVFGIEERGHT
jgi:hypothetical protein